jgi:RNA polymerase sigma-70 factor (ECF subfamily)
MRRASALAARAAATVNYGLCHGQIGLWADAMSTETTGFVALLDRARLGDQKATELLIRLYEPELRLVARVRLGAALRPFLDSVDLVQSVHRSLMMGLRQDRFDISSPEKLVALALTMVRRKVARQWRHLRRQQRNLGAPGDSGSLPDLLASLCDSQLNPAQAAEFQDAVEQVCAGLDDVQRRLIELRLDGYSTAEAARTMGLDPDVLRVQLSRLRRQLRANGVLTDWL